MHQRCCYIYTASARRGAELAAGLTVQLAGLLWRLCRVGLSQQKPRMKRLRIPQAIRNKPSRMLLSSASEYSYDTRIFAMAAPRRPPPAWRGGTEEEEDDRCTEDEGGGGGGGGDAVRFLLRNC